MNTEFYFIRHGQTDYNVSNLKVDHEDVLLNATGQQQALEIETVIAHLPIKSICYSPLKRAIETKDIISAQLKAAHHEIHDLRECTLREWDDMNAAGIHAHNSPHEHVRNYISRVQKGFNQALTRESPTLIVAHGGIHWALCCLLGISEHDWSVGNCVPVHFFQRNGQWNARKLT